MHKAIMVLLISFGVSSVLFPARAATYYVATSGNDAAAGTSWSVPVASISTGVALATVAGDIVLVSNGTYTINNQLTVANAITLASYNSGVQSPTTTIIKGNYPTTSNRCLQVTSPGAVISGLTFTNGWATNFGGGVYMSNGGTITNCVIVGNVVTSTSFGDWTRHGGGGLYMQRGTATWCTISGNTLWNGAGGATYPYCGGAGVHVSYTGSVEHCVITSNRMTQANAAGASFFGGAGVWVAGGAVATPIRILDCTIFGNLMESSGCRMYGAGVSTVSSSTIISNCVISRNSVTGPSTYASAGVFAYDYPPVRIDSCVISNNFDANGGAGAISFNQSGGHILTNCIIEGNTGDGMGIVYTYGAGYLTTSNYISNCTLRNNFGMQNAGVFRQRDASMFIDNCLITGNSATNNCYGSAFGYESYGSVNNSGRLRNCLITKGVAGSSGGGAGYGAVSVGGDYIGIVENCTIVSNRSISNGGGLSLNVGGSSAISNQVINCILYNNSDNGGYGGSQQNLTTNQWATFSYVSPPMEYITYSCSPKLVAGVGNITNAPAFVDTVGGDWHLTLNSPCVNVGSNLSWMGSARDLDGRARIDRMSGRADMGCYEFVFKGTLLTVH